MEITGGMVGTSNQPALSITGASSFSVCLDFFSGPMDLLLHLVRQQEVAIEDVKMALVCEQYLDIISKADFLDLDKATEYLVIAATLTAIKSQSLLPEDAELGEDADGEFDSRFFEDLRERLRAYEQTKLRAISLNSLPQLGLNTFTRVDRKALKADSKTIAEHGDAESLGQAFARLLKRIGGVSGSFRVRMEPISVVSCMMKIIDRLSEFQNAAKGATLSFSQMLQGLMSRRMSSRNESGNEAALPLSEVRGSVIGSFVAVLELVKRGVISASQESGGDIDISLRMSLEGEESDIGSISSEFDGVDSVEAQDADKVVHMADYRSETPEGVEFTDDLEKEANSG